MSVLSLAPVRTTEQFEQLLAAPAALRPWVTGVGRIPFLDDLAEPFTHVPHAVTTVVIRAERSGRRDVAVVGPRTRATYKRAEESATCQRLRLAPAAVRPLLGVAAIELTDRVRPLADFPGPLAGFTDRLLHSTPDEALRILEYALPHILSDDPEHHRQRRMLDTATAILAEQSIPVPEVAARLAISERQLRTLFATGIGLSPKQFSRIGRLRRVLADPTPDPLASTAATHGYYDQSHMTAEFRTLMGTAPSAYFRGALPAPTPCTTAFRS
ncbi:AraC family transcriptional regulator [Nocardia jiangxiensis]|uniref:Helix-turn-helix domain-containing protein n=1 Tax=Nocardia jiangxiensis TaxID=282685 RepID=A0ABW6RYB6_9NOCA|nr:helix-turn-helix domain-containing protein [Nocardia jiangxiensis]